MSPSDDSVAPLGDTPLPWRVGTWLAELLTVPQGLVDSYWPGSGGLGARHREQLILTISEVNDCRYSAWVHGSWLEFLGPRDLDEAMLPLFDYGRACAQAGVPLDTTTLDAAYPPALVRSVRATVAHAELANLVGNSSDAFVAQARNGFGLFGLGRSPSVALGPHWSGSDWVEGVATMALGVPFVLPACAAAVTMKALARLAPNVPEITLPAATDANLVAHLLAEATPTYLGHAVLRTSLVWSPLPIAIAFRMEGTSATIRVGRGRVVIENGVQPDVLLVVDGGVEPIVQTVAGSILRDLGVPMRRHR